jgi:periplasmic divalent cation tolerance protein
MTTSERRTVALITAPQDQARAIAAAIIERRLAACVNIVPAIQSLYWWDEKVEEDAEALLVVKTTMHAIPAVKDLLDKIHPYDTFELVSLEIASGNQAYLDWITDSVDLSK